MWPIIPANDPAKVSWVRVIVQTHQPRQECTGNQKRGTCVGSSFHELGRNSAWGTDTALTRIIHEDFYCNCRYAAMTSLMQAGSPLGPSPYGWGLVPFFLAPLPVLETG